MKKSISYYFFEKLGGKCRENYYKCGKSNSPTFVRSARISPPTKLRLSPQNEEVLYFKNGRHPIRESYFSFEKVG